MIKRNTKNNIKTNRNSEWHIVYVLVEWDVETRVCKDANAECIGEMVFMLIV